MPYRLTLLVLFALTTHPAFADGPADNDPNSVKRIPKLGIEVKPEVRDELQKGLADLETKAKQINTGHLKTIPNVVPDILIFHKAVADALKYQEFFAENEIAKARFLLKKGNERIDQLLSGDLTWRKEAGPVARAYRSKIDDSIQPYGVVVPPTYNPNSGEKYRLDIWCHGRGETLSELNFVDERSKSRGEFTPENTIVLHPYGRFCNANKFAGEIDLLEAIDAVKKNYRIDDDRIAIRGFSMGGAACWQFAVHYADHWFAANPGAGFAETARFLKVFQKEDVKPTWYEQSLWHMYDCTDLAVNLSQCPTVAYSGEIDSQKQAADVMAEALEKEGIALTHIIGPKTAHKYHPQAKLEVAAKLDSLAIKGRERFPSRVNFVTYTLKYNTMNWVTIDSLGEHWKKARIDADLMMDGSIEVKTYNVNRFTLAIPSGFAWFPLTNPVRVNVDNKLIEGPKPGTDRSWSLSLERPGGGAWTTAKAPEPGLRKKHDLQGPIDDAFMDSFVMVKPTGRSAQPKVQTWVEGEMAHAIEHWRRQFRGEARVKDDNQVDDIDIANSNLILWGDPKSNSILEKIADKLPIGWTSQGIKANDQTFDAANHALIAIYPNPLNRNKYVVLNSGFTFREYDYLNNARQVPKLPDWAVIDLRTPPDSRFPGKVVAADFFGEKWELKPSL